jgi:hypothetical protein
MSSGRTGPHAPLVAGGACRGPSGAAVARPRGRDGADRRHVDHGAGDGGRDDRSLFIDSPSSLARPLKLMPYIGNILTTYWNRR